MRAQIKNSCEVCNLKDTQNSSVAVNKGLSVEVQAVTAMLNHGGASYMRWVR